MTGQPLTRLMPEGFRAPHWAGVRRYLDTGEGPILRRTLEETGLRKDGAECPLELTVTAVQDETGHLFAGILRFLADSMANVVLINVEDLWGETLPQNVPATSTQRPNWRRRVRPSLEQIRKMTDVAEVLSFSPPSSSASPATATT